MRRSEVKLALRTNGTGLERHWAFFCFTSHPCSFMCQFQFPRLAKPLKGDSVIGSPNLHLYSVLNKNQNQTKQKTVFSVNTSVKIPPGESLQSSWMDTGAPVLEL